MLWEQNRFFKSCAHTQTHTHTHIHFVAKTFPKMNEPRVPPAPCLYRTEACHSAAWAQVISWRCHDLLCGNTGPTEQEYDVRVERTHGRKHQRNRVTWHQLTPQFSLRDIGVRKRNLLLLPFFFLVTRGGYVIHNASTYHRVIFFRCATQYLIWIANKKHSLKSNYTFWEQKIFPSPWYTTWRNKSITVIADLKNQCWIKQVQNCSTLEVNEWQCCWWVFPGRQPLSFCHLNFVLVWVRLRNWYLLSERKKVFCPVFSAQQVDFMWNFDAVMNRCFSLTLRVCHVFSNRTMTITKTCSTLRAQLFWCLIGTCTTQITD